MQRVVISERISGGLMVCSPEIRPTWRVVAFQRINEMIQCSGVDRLWTSPP